jgi:ActR/RegA family two-component response regulator
MAARALIVEDDRSWQQILSELLADAGLEVDVESSLEGAIACLRSRVHRLAVVDLALGDGDVGNQVSVLARWPTPLPKMSAAQPTPGRSRGPRWGRHWW